MCAHTREKLAELMLGKGPKLDTSLPKYISTHTDIGLHAHTYMYIHTLKYKILELIVSKWN